MRTHVRNFVSMVTSVVDLPEPIVEIGSYQVDGQHELADLRPLLPGKQYIGCDMRAGPGVDRVENVETGLTFSDESIGTIICVETLEHVFDVLAAFRGFRHVLKLGGVVIITSAMLFPIHDYPGDYWRFTPECFARLLSGFDHYHVWSEGDPGCPDTLYGIAVLEPFAGFDVAVDTITQYLNSHSNIGRPITCGR